MEGWQWEVCEDGEEASGTVRTIAGLAVAMSKGWRSEEGREEGEIGGGRRGEGRVEEGKEGRRKGRREGRRERRE